MKKTILVFKSNTDFDNQLIEFLKQKGVKLLIISNDNVFDWKFYLHQNEKNLHKGQITSPNKEIICLSEISAIYIDTISWLDKNTSSYEFNAWHALIIWLIYTLPNSIYNFNLSIDNNELRFVDSLKKNKIKFSKINYNHFVHCIGENLYASTTKGQMAILPPKTARKFLKTMSDLGFNNGQFLVNYNKYGCSCYSFSQKPDWSQCAFPKNILFQSIQQTLTKETSNIWLKSQLTPNFTSNFKSNECFIARELIPNLIGDTY